MRAYRHCGWCKKSSTLRSPWIAHTISEKSGDWCCSCSQNHATEVARGIPWTLGTSLVFSAYTGLQIMPLALLSLLPLENGSGPSALAPEYSTHYYCVRLWHWFQMWSPRLSHARWHIYNVFSKKPKTGGISACDRKGSLPPWSCWTTQSWPSVQSLGKWSLSLPSRFCVGGAYILDQL